MHIPHSTIRIFFAIELENLIKTKLIKCISTLKKKSKLKTLRFTENNHLHLTLQFVSAFEVKQLEKLKEKIRHDVLPHIKPFNIILDKISFFPSAHHPHVLALEVNINAELRFLAQAIGNCLGEFQCPIDTREYRPHITLARIKNSHIKDVVLNDLESIFLKDEMNIQTFTLFQSEPLHGQSSYKVLDKWKL